MIRASIEIIGRKLDYLRSDLGHAVVSGLFDGSVPMLDEINQRSEKEYVIIADFQNLEVQLRPISEDFKVEREKKTLLTEQVMTYRSKCYIAPLIKGRGREGGTQPIGWITRNELLEIFKHWKRYIAACVKTKILDLLR